MSNFLGDDDGLINLRDSESALADPEFQIHNVEEDSFDSSQRSENYAANDTISSSMVKVKFDKFVNLIATHAYEDIFERYNNEDIVVSTDLLTDLANAHEEKQIAKTPFIFLFGILLGILVSYFLMKV